MSWRWMITGAVAAVGAVLVAVPVKRVLDNPFRQAERELDKRDRALREEHPDTVALRHRAHYLSETGDLAGAVEISEQLLAERVRALGEDHPQVLTTRHNLANLRGRAGDAAGAAEALERLALDMERVHGADFIYTVVSRRAAVRWWEEAEGGSQGAE
ncbi:tetratricopeptide repeat protein [Streptomyces sp. NBC_00385]|uniref:tetratricopeptide repeat protein n=1 Tax=Streptomyces sp. NBC_00385 TaxID=2975733 RepID=UPI002DDBEECD|nr:tetratricopeptide repeat protein [Streptomyces sp. NBC_00385]WRZ08393.1 tetratricopeptide repeat protein [Streptomyces sp. NBC_00385]